MSIPLCKDCIRYIAPHGNQPALCSLLGNLIDGSPAVCQDLRSSPDGLGLTFDIASGGLRSVCGAEAIWFVHK